ncbi:low affinity iron permease family protein [Legionella brunensis]|uniref:Low affinity iron permease n=1 Tax=Legionella brunensis TaxID=29422 RepID=A0A0W0SS78_9GAMM|nr:low affinity iron permease family protein [Legionella brunensis]KTC86282.1 Low affinity iron permease [Legionella brunensis]
MKHRPKAKKTDQANNYFADFAKITSDIVGNVWSFILALAIIIIWIIMGPVFKFSDTWQLLINTGTTIITFLMVFLIQHTQNRDTTILNLKLDEIIKATKTASNTSLDLSKLTDEQLQALEKEYEKICNKSNKNGK